MRRFFVPPEQCRGDAFELPDREARHAIQVLRLSVDDLLTVLDGTGNVLTCRIVSATRREVQIAVLERQTSPPLPCAITLIQAIPKGAAFDNIIQKATELGVARIVPLLSARVVAQINDRDASAKALKWLQIAVESIKQCGGAWLPTIEAPVKFDRLIERVPRSDLALVCSLQPQSRSLREVAHEFRSANLRLPASASVWIGPEGDFTPEEYGRISGAGAVPISLGPNVLRADTAAIAGLAIANHELQPRV